MSSIIRTPAKATGGITLAEKAAMAEQVKLWTARAFRTDPIEPDKITHAIEGLYAAAGLKKPRIVIVPSPLVMAFSYGAAAAIWHSRNATDTATFDATDNATFAATDTATRNATVNATRTATFAATDNATFDATVDATVNATDTATRNATFDATYNATDTATRNATFDATRTAGAASACFALAGKLGIACAARWSSVYQGGNMWAPYVCYLVSFRDVLGLRLKEHDNYTHWEQAAIHGGFRVMHEEFCIVSDFPEILKIDDQNLPHCEDGPSHRWRDGWSLYHWHGVAIPQEWIEDKASLTAQTALTWENIEQRRAACEIVGWERILHELDAVTIDTDEDAMIGELVEVTLPDVGREKFLRVTCGTGRRFAIPMPPHVMTALAGNAWSYGVDSQVLRALEVRT